MARKNEKEKNYIYMLMYSLKIKLKKKDVIKSTDGKLIITQNINNSKNLDTKRRMKYSKAVTLKKARFE